MCTPKVPKVQPAVEKKPQYLRNPFLDGSAIQIGSRGRNSLRIDRPTAGRLNTTGGGDPMSPASPVVPKDLNNGVRGGIVRPGGSRIPGIGIPISL